MHNKIGTTKKGIGPAYMDKAARVGIRMADLLIVKYLKKNLNAILAEKNRMFERIYETEGFKSEEILEEYYEYGQKLQKYVCDTSVVLNDAVR